MIKWLEKEKEQRVEEKLAAMQYSDAHQIAQTRQTLVKSQATTAIS